MIPKCLECDHNAIYGWYTTPLCLDHWRERDPESADRAVRMSRADKLTHAPQLQAAYLRIEEHRRAVRRLELIWGSLALAFPIVLTLIAAYVIWLENSW